MREWLHITLGWNRRVCGRRDRLWKTGWVSFDRENPKNLLLKRKEAFAGDQSTVLCSCCPSSCFSPDSLQIPPENSRKLWIFTMKKVFGAKVGFGKEKGKEKVGGFGSRWSKNRSKPLFACIGKCPYSATNCPYLGHQQLMINSKYWERLISLMATSENQKPPFAKFNLHLCTYI